ESIEIGSAENIEVKIGTDFSFNSKEIEERKLTKPTVINEGYNWQSADGILTDGIELEKQRMYVEAREKYEQVLQKDAFNTKALTRMAGLHYRNMEYKKASKFALKALANDTYYPEA